MTDPDREISRLFEELRRTDVADAPGFRQVLGRRRLPHQGQAGSAWRPALIALGVVLCVAVVLIRHNADSSRVPTTGLTSWKAPTDALLQTPGAELFDSTPEFAEPIPDYSGLMASPETIPH
ncbi:MAG TPA: hypothetical protein VGL03_12965 [Thermoanaerobaculia bacterium]